MKVLDDRHEIDGMATGVDNDQPQHQRRLIADGRLVRPERHQIVFRPGVAQVFQESHVAADARQQLTSAGLYLTPQLVADEIRVGHP